MSTVLTLIEHADTGLARSSGEALTLGRRLAEAYGAPLHAAAVGAVPDDVVKELGAHGVAHVHALAHPLLDAEAAPAALGESVRQLTESLEARAVVGAASDRDTASFAHLAARMDQPLAAHCVSVTVVDDGLELSRVRWGGVIYEEAHLDAEVMLLTVAPHQVTVELAAAPAAAELTGFAPELGDELDVARLVEREELSGGISLATAPVVIAGGRGVGSAEGFAVLEELAELLGGAVGCSRVATNAGWRSHNDQIGQTGTRVAPDLYIACGISGATQHWVGCMNAKRILSINTDPEAPMITRADEAVVGDLHEFLPALVEEVRSRKG